MTSFTHPALRVPALLLPAALTALLLAPLPARAGEMDAKQVTIAAKALGFLTPKLAAGAKVAVAPGAAPLAAVQAALPGDSVTAGTTGSVVFSASTADAKKALAKGVVTVGNDVACVEAGACVIAVETTPKVTIYVSHAASSTAGVDFDPNFKMMITEK